MMKINAIIKELKKYDKITDYAIDETISKSCEQFYDLQKLETARETLTDEINVRIYTVLQENDKKYLGNASFIVSHKLSKKELDTMIEDAIYQASFVKNEYYEIPSGEKKLSFKQKKEDKEPFELLQNIADIFFSEKTDECMFNALECFYYEKEIRLVNSRGVDYKKTIHNFRVEAIPSFKKLGGNRCDASELYRMFKYDTYDEAKIKEDAKRAISSVLNRSKAVKINEELKVNVILKDEEILEMAEELIYSYHYADVYKHTNFKNIGDYIQENPVNPLTISYIPASKADYFDSDGVLLKEAVIIEDGKVKDYYGNNRYGYYLNKKPTGTMDTVKVNPGKKNYEKMKKEPYIEITDLSGLQVDLFGDYIGGEVRCANYFDGKNTYPITAFSFSGSLQECINNLELSKEKTKISYYQGPKYALLKNMNII